jgi:hypothetical protein
MRLVLDKIEEMNPGNLKLKQFAGDLANTLKTSYENKIRPAVTGGKQGAGQTGASFFEGLGLTGVAEAYKKKAEAKEQRHQDKEAFVQNFQNHSTAGKNLSLDTSRQVGEELFEQIQSKQKEMAELQTQEKKVTEAGYKVDQENLDRQKALGAELEKLDPRKKETEAKDQSIQQVESGEAKIEAAELSKEQMEVTKKQESDLTALYTISDDFFKKQTERTDKMVEALETLVEKAGEGGGGGLLASAAEAAGDMLGGKKGGAAGKAGTAAKAAGALGKVAKIGGGVLAVGTAAYEGYNEYKEADDKVKSGEISKEEGQVKKGEAVGGGVGGAGGALAGAAAGAALGSVVPVVGTAIGGLIGGAVGYWGGKKAGQAVGGGAVQGYQALSGPGAAAAPATAAGNTSTSTTNNNQKTTTNVDAVTQSPVYQQEYMKQKDSGADDAAAHKAAVQKASMAPTAAAQKIAQSATAATVAPVSTGQVLNQTNTQVTSMKEAAVQPAPANNTVVNAPVTNVSGGSAPAEKKTTKDPVNRETTLDKYLDRRFYPVTR